MNADLELVTDTEELARIEKLRLAAQAMKANKIRDKNLTQTMILINIGVAIIVSLLITTLLLLLTKMPVSRALALGCGLGVITWSQILFRTKVFDYCFINVKQNWVVVLGNQIHYDNIPDNPDDRIALFERGALREVGQGIRGKWPWEIAVDSVKLRSEVLIGPGKDGAPLQCVTSDNVQLDIRWQVVITPLVGFAVNLIRRNQETLETYFKGIFDQKIITWVNGRPKERILLELANLKEVFKDTLGGSGEVSIEEMEWGAFTNNPQIISVTKNARQQRADEGLSVGTNMVSVIKQINTTFGETHDEMPDSAMVLATAAAMVGEEIPGLVLIPGGGKGLLDPLSKMGLKPTEKKSTTKEEKNKKGGKKHE